MKPVFTAWLITPRAPSAIPQGYANIPRGDLVIAVDGGLERCLELGITPHYLCGDLDSVDQNLAQSVHPDRVWRFLPEKDETDTELALLECLARGVSQIVICNDLQGRVDHALGLIQNLLLAHCRGVSARIETGFQSLFFLPPDWEASDEEDTLLSLIAWEADARFETSCGLKWDLKDLCLKPELSRGISNRIISSPARIKLHSGRVLAILTKRG